MVSSFYRAQLCAAGELKRRVRQRERSAHSGETRAAGAEGVRPQGKRLYLSGKRTEPSSLRNGAQPGMRRAPAAENESVPNFADRAFGGFCPLLFCV